MKPGEGPPSHRAVEAVWRIESARLVGGLERVVRAAARTREHPAREET